MIEANTIDQDYRIDAVRLSEGERSHVSSSCLLSKDRDVALNDLTHQSFFRPLNDHNGPYVLNLDIKENRIIFHIVNAKGDNLPYLVVSVNPYRRLIKDYFLICQSYDQAVTEGKPSRIEAIDMGRRGIHNEGAELLQDRLSDKIALDMETARRLFTLICVLHGGKTHALR